MTKTEIAAINRAIALLSSLTGEPYASVPLPRTCPVRVFAQRYLVRNPDNSMTCQEIWTFFAEVAASGEVEPLSKAQFLRRLPAVMGCVFGVRKSHHIERAGGRVRGFKGITLNEQA